MATLKTQLKREALLQICIDVLLKSRLALACTLEFRSNVRRATRILAFTVSLQSLKPLQYGNPYGNLDGVHYRALLNS